MSRTVHTIIVVCFLFVLASSSPIVSGQEKRRRAARSRARANLYGEKCLHL
jgi:hypothetical protein